MLQHNSENIESLVSASTAESSQAIASSEIDENMNNNYNNSEKVDIKFERVQVKLLETITKNSLLTFIIIVADITYSILFVVLNYQASFDQDLWFATNFMLFVTVFCDLVSLVLGFVFSKKYYEIFCTRCNTMCGWLCHQLAKRRVNNKVLELQTNNSASQYKPPRPC